MNTGSIIAGGFRLVREQPRSVALWTLLLIVAFGPFVLLMSPLYGELAQQQAAAMAGGAVTPGFHGRMIAWILLLDVAVLVLYIVIFAAAVRAVARTPGHRIGYLRIGMDEVRLLGLGLILLGALIVAEIVSVLFIILVSVVFGLLIGKAALVPIMACFGFMLFCALVYAEVRLSLAGALTVLHGRIVVKDAWRLTKGCFWRLFGAYLVLSIIFVFVTLVLLAIFSPHLLAAYFAFDQTALLAASQEQAARFASHPLLAILPQVLIGSAVTGVMLAVSFGAVATAAIELEAERRIPITM